MDAYNSSIYFLNGKANENYVDEENVNDITKITEKKRYKKRENKN
jgi:hypothetical protein